MLAPWIANLRSHPAVAKLLRSVALARRFQFFILVAEPPAVYAVLKLLEEDVAAARKRPVSLRQLDPYAAPVPKIEAAALMQEILEPILFPSPSDEPSELVWAISAARAGPEDEGAWSVLFQRMNERRNHIAQSIAAPLLLCLPPHMERVFAKAAPDFWSISSLLARVEGDATEAQPPAAHVPSKPAAIRSQRIFVISDLHLGGLPELRRCPPHMEAALAHFIEWIGNQPSSGGEPHLVIAGNLVDFLLEPPHLAFTDNEDEACAKLATIMHRSQPVFAALSKYVARGGRLTLLLGNHDLELSLPQPRALLLQRLGQGRVEFLYDNQALRLGSVLIEHGERYDRWNAVSHDALRAVRSQLSRKEPPAPFPASAGSRLVVELMLPLMTRYPFIGHVKPEAAVLPLLSLLEPSLSSSAVRIGNLALARKARDLDAPPEPELSAPTNPLPTAEEVDLASPGLLSQTKNFLLAWFSGVGSSREVHLRRLRRALLPLRSDRSWDLSIETNHVCLDAARAATERGFKVVVFGHTHLCKHVEMPNGGLYLNCGTWTEQLRLPDDIFSTDEGVAMGALAAFMDAVVAGQTGPFSITQPTFVQIDVAPDKPPSASLYRFDTQQGLAFRAAGP